MKLRTIAAAGTGLLFLALTAFAQVTTIEGIVKGTDGKPVEKAGIKIIRTDIKAEYKTKTDKKGHYLYMGLPIGTYNVELYGDDKYSQKMDAVNGVRTSLGDPKPVNFDLATSAAAKQATQAEMQKAVETGQISKELERGLSKEQKEAMDKQIKQQSEQMKKRGELNTAFNAGMEAMNAKNWEAAVENFTKASELDPAQVAVWAQLGEANLRVASTKTGADFDAAIGKALQAYSKSIELKPDDPASHNNYALALVRAKKLPEAQAELKKAADLDPQNGGKYYYNLGAVLTNAGQYDTAGEAFKKAIELTPTYADAYYQYGMTLSSKMQTTADGKVTAPDEMKNAFKKYLELQPNGPNAEAAKAMLQSVEGSVQTKFSDPTKKAEPAKKKK